MYRDKPTIKTADELRIMREGGKILADIVKELSKEVKEGNDSIEVNRYADFLCKRYKVKPAFLGYGSRPPFPATICANLNEVVVHGIPTATKFKSGDIFGLDMGIVYYGMNLDMSVTVSIGKLDPEVVDFVNKTKTSMMNGIKKAVPGNKVGMISVGMRDGLLSDKFRLMRDFVGHGVGRHLHEAPEIPGEGMEANQGVEILPGMVLAIESISVLGPTNSYDTAKDGWTVYTKDRKYLSGLFEHTVIVTENGPEIITNID